MSKLLYEYQQDCEDAKNKFLNKLEYYEGLVSSGELTLKEFLDLGFNSSKLLKKDDYNWEFITGYKNSDKCKDKYGEYSEDLSDEMMNVKVINSGDAYEDYDGYFCMNVLCVNEKDYELFDKELAKDNIEL